MYAVIKIAGQQYKVSKDDVITTQKLSEDTGDTVEFDHVILLSSDDDVKIGTPFVDGVKVQATVLEQFKDDKVTIFKKKRRKGYRVKRGHRQPLTKLKIVDIVQ